MWVGVQPLRWRPVDARERHAAPAAQLADRFYQLTGKRPHGLWQAPGRVNLIGEHTDYNEGLALPFAIDRRLTVAVRRRRDRQVRCFSTGEPAIGAADLDDLRPGSLARWARYPVGVLWALQRVARADVPGVDLVVDSTVASGAGLSSSAALEAAVAVAVNDLGDLDLDRRRLADVCHAAESDFVGAPVGMMDPLAVLFGEAGRGLLIDFRSQVIESLPLGMGPLVVVDTHVRHETTGGAYAARRRRCREAADRLGLPALRDATADQVAADLDGELQRRARHVVSEDQRVLEAARRLRSGAAIGELLTASHVSLRDDFDVSCPELDAVVEAALDAGALGARLTGAGFGGCAIVLGLDAGSVTEALGRRFRGPGRRVPTAFAVVASDGAGRVA
jgi:galactokinase